MWRLQNRRHIAFIVSFMISPYAMVEKSDPALDSPHPKSLWGVKVRVDCPDALQKCEKSIYIYLLAIVIEVRIIGSKLLR